MPFQNNWHTSYNLRVPLKNVKKCNVNGDQNRLRFCFAFLFMFDSGDNRAGSILKAFCFTGYSGLYVTKIGTARILKNTDRS